MPSRRPANSRSLRNGEPTATPPWPRQSVTSVSTPRICLSVRSLAPPASSQPRITLRRTASGRAVNRPVSRPSPGGRGGQRRLRQLVERLGVLAQRGRGAGKRLGDTAAEHILEQRQHLGAQPGAGVAAIGVVRVVPRFDPQLVACLVGDARAGRRAAGGTTAGRTAACPRSSGRPIRGRGPAARSRPGRRACARAVPGRRPLPRPARGSGPFGRRPPARPSCRRRRKGSARQRIPSRWPVPWRLPRRGANPAAVGGRRSARSSASLWRQRPSAPSESGPPDNATHHRSSAAT